MTLPLFDPKLLTARRRRALATGFRSFLHERAIEDLADRLRPLRRRFERAVLVGLPDPALAAPLGQAAASIVLADDLDALAALADPQPDMILLLGQLDTAEDLRGVIAALRAIVAPGGLVAGVFPGGQSLPVLRAAMLAADRSGGGGAAPRVHPRIEAAAFAGLLGEAGFADPVVDIDRIRLRYRSLGALVADLRQMGATNAMSARGGAILRTALLAATTEFDSRSDGEGVVETIELIHFVAWG